MIVDDVAMATCVWVFAGAYIFIPFGFIPTGGMAGSRGNSVFNLLIELTKHFPKQLHRFLSPPAAY